MYYFGIAETKSNFFDPRRFNFGKTYKNADIINNCFRLPGRIRRIQISGNISSTVF